MKPGETKTTKETEAMNVTEVSETKASNPSKKDKNTKRNRTIITTVAIVIVLAITIVLLVNSCSGGVVSNPNILFDPNATNDDVVERSEQDILDELNQKVEDGMINISMNLNPYFESGTSKGNLLINNSERNKHPQYVTIIRDDTGETIYKSGGIKVGSRIDKAALDVNLSAGVYDCTATFTQYDEETSTVLGSAAARLTITVGG